MGCGLREIRKEVIALKNQSSQFSTLRAFLLLMAAVLVFICGRQAGIKTAMSNHRSASLTTARIERRTGMPVTVAASVLRQA